MGIIERWMHVELMHFELMYFGLWVHFAEWTEMSST